MTHKNYINVVCNNPKFQAKANHIAQQLDCNVIESITDSTTTIGLLVDEVIKLSVQIDSRWSTINVDFNSEKIQWWQKTIGKKHPLAKSLGLTKYKIPPKIIDATAGMGKDAFLMAHLGCEVLLLEINPLVAIILADGIERICDKNLQQKMILKQTDSIDFLINLKPANYPDVIYLDPMFPERKKSAKVKKELQVLQAINQHTNSDSDLLNISVKRAKSRVVVKRPIHASNINNLKPDFTQQSKTIRYDVYLTKQNSA